MIDRTLCRPHLATRSGRIRTVRFRNLIIPGSYSQRPLPETNTPFSTEELFCLFLTNLHFTPVMTPSATQETALILRQSVVTELGRIPPISHPVNNFLIVATVKTARKVHDSPTGWPKKVSHYQESSLNHIRKTSLRLDLKNQF